MIINNNDNTVNVAHASLQSYSITSYSRLSLLRFMADLIISVKCGILLSVRLLPTRLWKRTEVIKEYPDQCNKAFDALLV